MSRTRRTLIALVSAFAVTLSGAALTAAGAGSVTAIPACCKN